MGTLDDHIAQSLRESERNGELRSAPSFGKPLAQVDGFDETPEELRQPFKILKDAGVVPAEVELMKQLAALKQVLADTDDEVTRQALQQRISELQQALSLRLEQMRRSG